MKKESTQKLGVMGKGRESKGYLFSVHLNNDIYILLTYDDFKKLVEVSESKLLRERASVYPLCFSHVLDRMVFEVNYPCALGLAEAYNIYATFLKLKLHDYREDWHKIMDK